MKPLTLNLIVLGLIVLALAYVIYNYIRIKKMKEGSKDLSEMAAIIRSGATMFLKTEFRTIAIVVAIIAIALSLFIEKTAGATFLLGACMSSIVCVLGMRSATYANVRTVNKARETLSIGETIKVALSGGSISGLSVQAFGMLGLVAVMLIWDVPDPEATGSGFLLRNLECNPYILRLSSYSLGCSIVAMFNRVAGGNYTKAADISSDILAKLRHDLPEDDSRVPNVIADFIGDNVNDIAGNCSDLLESFVATMCASLMIAVFMQKNAPGAVEFYHSTLLFPIALAGVGLLGCLIGLGFAAIKKMGNNPSRELNLSTWISAGITLGLSALLAYFIFGKVALPEAAGFKLGWISPWISSLLGIVSGVAIGIITEYYTSADFKPTKKLAEMAQEGEAFVITKGDAIGSRSCLLPVLVIAACLIISGIICGSYGIAISALGMLSFVGATVSIDAFGPIADNAGGFAESCGLDPKVRAITDKLDAAGNTTAAVGKGFAIGSAAFATISLISSYIQNYGSGIKFDLKDEKSFLIIAGGILGGALVEFFSAMLTDNTVDAAKIMADEGDKLLSIPGVLEGTVKPDYNKMIRTATKEALHKMVVPSVFAIVIPIIGLMISPLIVCGLLIGATIVAIPRAIFMGNSGGAFDNAKKYIETDNIKGCGKGTPAHKAAVTGDTVGDTRKDVVGVALDIFIKMMSTVANSLATVFSNFHLF